MDVVTQREFDEQLARAEREVTEPAAGVFGPGSVTWRVSRESVCFLGAGRAALLQLAHPYVAHAVDQHSSTRTDPVGRFNRTFLNVYGMIFGDLAQALGSARRVRSVHDRVHGAIGEEVGRFARGHRYNAHDPGALFWVHATLLDTAVSLYELGFGPLSPGEKGAYYEELRRFAWLFGIPDSVVPADWAGFERYMAEMFASDVLAVGGPAREMGRFLLEAPSAALKPVSWWFRAMTAGMLPPRLREGYGLSFGRADRIAYEGSRRAVARGWAKLPERVRFVPDYIEAERRLAGRPRRDRAGRAMEQLVLRLVRPRAPPR